MFSYSSAYVRTIISQGYFLFIFYYESTYIRYVNIYMYIVLYTPIPILTVTYL